MCKIKCNNCSHSPICSVTNDFENFIKEMIDKQNELYRKDATNPLFNAEFNCRYYTKDENVNKDYM